MACEKREKTLDKAATGNKKDDWEIFDVLCMQNSEMEEDSHDAMTALKSELAALQYKRDKLLSELNEMRAQIRRKEERNQELQSETEILKEQAARQNAIIASLKKRIQELEERERNLSQAHGRSEAALETLQRENKYQEEKIQEFVRKIRSLEVECHAEEQSKLAARESMSDFVRKLSNALDMMETVDSRNSSQECLLHKAADLLLEISRLRSRTHSLEESLHAVGLELKDCREALEKAMGERESLQRQTASLFVVIDKLRKEKEDLEIHQKSTEREICDLREKLALSNKNLGCISVNKAAQEVTINQLRDECKIKEERVHRLQHELRLLLESMAISLSSSDRFIGSTEEEVKNAIKSMVQDSKEKAMQNESLKEKLNLLSEQLSKQSEINEEANRRFRLLEDEKNVLETRLAKAEEDLHKCNVAKESLKADKAIFMSFIEKLNRAFNMDEIAKGVDPEMMIESLLIRAEKLSRLEENKIFDKTNAMYQMQRKLRTLKEQLQRKDLHLDLLRRKLSIQEENFREKSSIAVERDEAALKCKKLMKQIEKLQTQLADGKTLSQDIKNHLAEAGDFKIAALERGRKVEELQKRLVDAETVISRCNKKIAMLKEELRKAGQTAHQERTISEQSLHHLREELTNIKLSLAECSRRENQLHGFRASACKALCLPPTATDYELLTKLEKLVAAHRDFTLLSRRYEDPVLGANSTPVPTPKYEDSGFLDQHDLSPLEDNDEIYHLKHSH